MVQKKQNWAKSLTAAINLATNVAAVIAIGLFGGMWLDKKFLADNPENFFVNNIFTVLGFALGVATAMKIMWDALMERDRQRSAAQKQSDQDEK